METTLLTTKLFIPPARPGLVARPRLMERLQSALSCSLVLISAPAGSGKTTLVSDWVRRVKEQCPTAWVSLDEGDNDPVRFWDYFIAALQKLRPTIGETALSLLLSPQPTYPIEAVLTALINDLSSISDDLALVLDDYHLIKSEDIHTGITFLLDHLPPKMHLVIATRTDPPLALAHFRGRGTMLEIGADDLRFTLDEAINLLREILGPALSSEDIEALNQRTEGWAVGLKMAALSLGQRKDVKGFVATFTGSQRYVGDYLIEEVLKQQSDKVRDFLLQTSVLEKLSASLCDSVTARSGSQDMLVELERANLFLVPLDESREWYRYHHLFTDLLRHQLVVKLGTEEVMKLHQWASQWYEDNKFPDDAIHHALASRDWDRAIKLIGNVAENRMKRGENITLFNWLQAMPDEVLRTDLHLYGQFARVLVLTGQFEVAETVLSYLEKTAQADANLQGEVAVLQADIAHRRGDSPRAIELAERALSLLPPDNLAYRCRASSVLGLVHIDGGLYGEAWSRYTDAYELARQAEDYLVALAALAYRSHILSLRGKLQEAVEMCQQAIDLAEQSPASALARQVLGFVLHERNDLEGAAYHLLLATELNEIRGNPDSRTYSYTLLARTRLAQGDSAAALAAIGETELPPRRGTLRLGARARLAAMRILLALQQDDLKEASNWGRRLSEYSDTLLFEYRYVSARLLIARGEKTAAANQLQDFYEKAVMVDALGIAIKIRVYQALAAETSDEALAFLTEALVKGQPEGFIRTFVDEGKLLAPLLSKALSQGVTPEYTSKLLDIIEAEERQRQSQSGIAPSHPPTGLLSERELEILRLVVSGLSNRQIAERLIISLGTVKTHVHNIFEKLNVKTRTQAINRARELKLI